MFQHISKEDKAFLNVSIDALGTCGNDPDQHLEEHATMWEDRWHVADDKINKAIHKMLLIILELAKKDRYNSTTLDLDKYEQGLKGYGKDTRGIDTWTATELRTRCSSNGESIHKTSTTSAKPN